MYFNHRSHARFALFFPESFSYVNIYRYIPELSDSSREYSHVPRDNTTANLNIVSDTLPPYSFLKVYVLKGNLISMLLM